MLRSVHNTGAEAEKYSVYRKASAFEIFPFVPLLRIFFRPRSLRTSFHTQKKFVQYSQNAISIISWGANVGFGGIYSVSIKNRRFSLFSIHGDFIDFSWKMTVFCENPKNPKKHEKHGDGASDTGETRQNSYCLVPRHPPHMGGVYDMP